MTRTSAGDNCCINLYCGTFPMMMDPMNKKKGLLKSKYKIRVAQ